MLHVAGNTHGGESVCYICSCHDEELRYSYFAEFESSLIKCSVSLVHSAVVLASSYLVCSSLFVGLRKLKDVDKPCYFICHLVYICQPPGCVLKLL